MGFKNVIDGYLSSVFSKDLSVVARVTCAELYTGSLRLEAFGAMWEIKREGIYGEEGLEVGPRGILISMYLNSQADLDMRLLPFRSFKELPGSMPYQDAFKARSELVLVPYIFKIMKHYDRILERLKGEEAKPILGGDMSFIVRPFPKIALGYIFYLPDEDFPASVTCLFSNNADHFMPIDGLADTAEQTSKSIISML